MRHATIVIIIVAFALAACSRPSSTPTPAATAETPDLARPSFARFGYDVEPRTYEVPPGRAAEVRRILTELSYPVTVVSPEGAQTQYVQPRVTFTSGSHVVIVAPTQYHPRIAELLEQLRAEPATTDTGAYEVTYWVVKATPVEASVLPPVGGELGDIAPVLQALAGLGPRAFALVDRASTRTGDGLDASIRSRVLEVEQTLSTAPGGVELAVELKVNNSAASQNVIRTTLPIALGQSSVLGDTLAPESDGADAVLLFVVSVRAAR